MTSTPTTEDPVREDWWPLDWRRGDLLATWVAFPNKHPLIKRVTMNDTGETNFDELVDIPVPANVSPLFRSQFYRIMTIDSIEPIDVRAALLTLADPHFNRYPRSNHHGQEKAES
jgi:hypothetical protein